MALMLSYSTLKREAALFSPLLILGFPIFDTGYLIWIRLTKKKIPFKKSNDHLALRLLILGYSKKKALFVMFALCLFFSLCGIFVLIIGKLVKGPFMITILAEKNYFAKVFQF